MKIERCFVMDCTVYTKFVGRPHVIHDRYDTPEQAREEQQALLHLNAVLNGSQAA